VLPEVKTGAEAGPWARGVNMALGVLKATRARSRTRETNAAVYNRRKKRREWQLIMVLAFLAAGVLALLLWLLSHGYG